jgi:hypothetical protein
MGYWLRVLEINIKRSSGFFGKIPESLGLFSAISSVNKT